MTYSDTHSLIQLIHIPQSCHTLKQLSHIATYHTLKHTLVTYCKVWLISASAYYSRWQGNMRLLGDVHLMESDILSMPSASTLERSITTPASYELSDS
jgi:hypothetical protein